MPHATPRVRDYAPGDFDGVLELWRATGLGGPERGDTAEVVERTLAAGGRLLLLVEGGRRVVGTSWLTHDARRTYLHHFGIHPDRQRRGLGKLLLEATMAAAARLGFQVKLEVHEDNVAAIRLYESAGFKRLGDYDTYLVRDLSSRERCRQAPR